MALITCPKCKKDCEDHAIRRVGHQVVCPTCAESLKSKPTTLQPAGDVLSNFPKAPRPVTEAVRHGYLSQNAGRRTWMWVWGIGALLAIPGLAVYSDLYEIGPLRKWPNAHAKVGGLPEAKKILAERAEHDAKVAESDEELPPLSYNCSVVFWSGEDLYALKLRRRPFPDVNPESRPSNPKLFQVPCEVTADEALRIHESLKRNQQFAQVWYRFGEGTDMIGAWAYDGKGVHGRIAELRQRNRNLSIGFFVMAVLGFISAMAHRMLMAGKVKIYRDGTFVLADSVTRIDVFQREYFDAAMDWISLGKVWFILKLHLNILYLVRTPRHQGMLILQMAPGVAPWHVDGKMVVCYLPDDPDTAVLIPNDVGQRLSIGA